MARIARQEGPLGGRRGKTGGRGEGRGCKDYK